MHWKLEMKGTSVIIDPLMLQRKIWGSSGQWPRRHKALRAGVSLPCDLLLLLPHLAGYLYLAAITAWVRLCHSPVQNPPVIPSFIHSKSQDLRRTCKTLDYPRHTFHPPPQHYPDALRSYLLSPLSHHSAPLCPPQHTNCPLQGHGLSLPLNPGLQT